MRHRTRKRLAILILVLAVPAYIVAAVSLVAQFDRPPIWLELIVYVVLGLVWALPLRRIFLGVAQPPPPAASDRPDAPADRREG